MGIVDDRTAEFLAEIHRAMEESRQEAGLPPTSTAAPSLEDLAAAVRESGLVGALNNVAATTISNTVSLCFFIFWVPHGKFLMVSEFSFTFLITCRRFCVPHGNGICLVVT
jgi:hypothetical protein